MSAGPLRLSIRIRVQIAALAIVTAATLLATWLLGQSAGAYQSAVRQDAKRYAAVVEDIRTVYGDEAPRAFRTAVAEARAQRLRPLRREGRLAASEYVLADRFAVHTRGAAPRDSLLGNGGYRNHDLGYDLPRRLVDLQHDSPALYEVDPEATMHDGDRWAAWGLAAAAAGAAAVIAAAIAANIIRPRRWQAARSPSGQGVLHVVEFLPQPAVARAGHRRGVLFHLAVFVLPLLLTLGQILVAGGEQRAQAEAARKVVQANASVEGYGLRASFRTEAVQTALDVEFAATARELASLDTGTAPRDARHERVVATVENMLAAQVQQIAVFMGRAPDRQDRLDSASAAVLSNPPEKLTATLAEQNRQVSLADEAGRRALLLSAATAVAVVAEILVVAAFAVGYRRWLWWPALGGLIATALAASAFL
ncbi:hypothetical protein ACIRJS_05285 [Streptomyces sp. NPDC102340]|uniref:hypothetical protein n=1 Tax=unclassified Streptomyces TaxID=2593676 RepID=UPI0038225A06